MIAGRKITFKTEITFPTHRVTLSETLEVGTLLAIKELSPIIAKREETLRKRRQ
mgnify:CR=1 FL=1